MSSVTWKFPDFRMNFLLECYDHCIVNSIKDAITPSTASLTALDVAVFGLHNTADPHLQSLSAVCIQVVKMNQEQKNGDIPPAYIVSTSQVSEKRRQYKKYAIIAGSAVLVVAIILTAILVGLYFFSETQKEIIKFSFTRDDNSKEEVKSDPNTNVVQYHVNSDKYELWVYNDFNRDIQVLKIKSDYGANCYVTPLNRTIADDPSKIVAPNGVNPSGPNKTYHVNYRTAKEPISDSTFLCKQARDVCKGISTYWMYPTCDDDSTAMEKRQKRGIRWGIGASVYWGRGGWGVGVGISIRW